MPWSSIVDLLCFVRMLSECSILWYYTRYGWKWRYPSLRPLNGGPSELFRWSCQISALRLLSCLFHISNKSSRCRFVRILPSVRNKNITLRPHLTRKARKVLKAISSVECRWTLSCQDSLELKMVEDRTTTRWCKALKHYRIMSLRFQMPEPNFSAMKYLSQSKTCCECCQPETSNLTSWPTF